MYIYPDNLKSKATLWLWELKDIAVIGILALIAVFALAQTGIMIPLVAALLYAFLSIQFEGISILGFIKSAAIFFITKQQLYEWRL